MAPLLEPVYLIPDLDLDLDLDCDLDCDLDLDVNLETPDRFWISNKQTNKQTNNERKIFVSQERKERKGRTIRH